MGCYTFEASNNIIIMGKGDRKTKKGKIARGSYGVTRPRKKPVTPTPPKKKAKKTTKKTTAKKATAES